MNKHVIIMLTVLALGAGCKRKVSFRQTPVPSAPVTVKVVSVHLDRISGSTAYVGTVSSSRSAILSAPAPGTLESLIAREGTAVTKGQVLGCVRSQAVQSSFKAAASRLAQAEDAMKRMQSVYESGAVTEVDYNALKTKLEEARAVEAAARDTRDRLTLKAPFSGIVNKVWPVVGTEVSIAQPILEILDVSTPEIHFSLPENEYYKYSEGTNASIEVTAIGKSFTGRLERKGLVASPLSRSYDCTVALPEGAREVLPGMVCKVRLESRGRECAVIPASAVLTDTGGRFVWTATGGRVDKKYVSIDGFSGNGIVISEGLAEGDLVIVEGARKVSTGMNVNTTQ